MSLYNSIFGVNPYAAALLRILGTRFDKVPRFRDVFVNEDGGEIVIFTRTGGGNREFHENGQECRRNYPEAFSGADPAPSGPWNEDLRQIPGFIKDEDCEFDETYAYFHYRVPGNFRDIVADIREKQGVRDPMAEFQQMLNDLGAGKDTPATRQAKKAAEPIFAQIEKAIMRGGKPTIIKV